MTFSPICINKRSKSTLNNTGVYIDNNYVVFVNIKYDMVFCLEISINILIFTYDLF
jgi:hypothetical protein